MIKKWMAMALIAGSLLGCGSGEACDVDAATRCAEMNVETCSSGEWTVTIDCVAADQECMQQDDMMEGEAHCMGGMEM